MNWKSTTAGFGAPAIFLHWLMLALIVVVYAMMDLKSLTVKGSPQRNAMAMWHYMLGLSVFALAWARLLVRTLGSVPQITPPPPAWEARLASIVHIALYALMIGLPLLGWLTLSAKGDPIPFFGVELPPLTAKNEALARTWKEIHETSATVGYFLIGLHAAAALYHHYVRRDNTMTMMWRGD